MLTSKAFFSGSFVKQFLWERFTLWDRERTTRSGFQRSSCCCASEIPAAAREPYINLSYRPIGASPKRCATSLFEFHNETLNVWTHLFAACYFMSVLYRDMSYSWDSDEKFDNLFPCFVFAFCLVICFTASATAHLFNCISVEARKTLFVIDYAGVGVNALGAGIYYTAYMPEEFIPTGNRNIYSSIMVLMVCLATIGCSLAMVYWSNWPAGQSLKAISFGSIAIQGNVPMIIYLWHLFSIDPQSAALVAPYFWGYVFFKFTAGFFLASSIPERFFPLVFDLFGHSHQLFHVTGFLSVIFQYNVGYILSDINPVECTVSTRWRIIATLFGGLFGLVMIVLFFKKEIRRLKYMKLKML